MRTLLLNPPSCRGFDGGAGSRYQARREVKSFWYPTWLAYAAGLTEGSRLLDASAEDMDAAQVVREARGYELIIIHTSTPTFTTDAGIAEKLKSHYPGIVVGFVGPHVTALPEVALQTSRAIDFVALGEFDYTVAEIAEGRPLSEVRGVAFRANGTVRRTTSRPAIEDLDALPFVTSVYARDLNPEHYFIGYLQHPYVSLYAGRGCRSRCTFCLWPQTISGHTYRVRSPENVCEEVALAKQLLPNVREFFFDDDTFTDNPHLDEIAQRLGRLNITWSCNARAAVSRETLALLRENGLRLLVVGFESGNQKILNGIRKGIRVEQEWEFVKAAKELGILIHGTFILGLPGETAGTIEETIRFAKEIDPYSVQVSLAAPYPGTELYEQAKRSGWLAQDETCLVREGIQNAVLTYEGLDAEAIYGAVERFYRSFYLRPGPVLRILREMLHDRRVFARRMREGKEFFSFMARRKEVVKC
ncbi:MAG TPA: hopanoid biosynthesis associated radical SAM protein HpnJ [Syntrophorhabdales bacterium]|nr:hopanoid biosynthesis associated radical SAM protein HpnJ [Syntrophorhabdales bacterium]